MQCPYFLFILYIINQNQSHPYDERTHSVRNHVASSKVPTKPKYAPDSRQLNALTTAVPTLNNPWSSLQHLQDCWKTILGDYNGS